MVDEYNNKLYREGNQVWLELDSLSHRKNLGTIITNNTLRTWRNYDNHLHRKSNSFGFNLKLLKSGWFKDVTLVTNRDEVFHVSVADILKNGKVLFFKQQGFEKQIFYPVDLLNA